jgi:hypothetical protein
MSDQELSPEAEVEEINISITDGLKSCRSMVAHYRAMIRGDDGANDNAPEEHASKDERNRTCAPEEVDD